MGRDARVVWVVGASSGIGRAAALSAGTAGWRVALSARRASQLEEVAVQISPDADAALAVPLDIGEPGAVVAAAAAIVAHFGRIDAVVLAAGLNSPARSWDDQDLATFDRIVQTNLVAQAHLVSAALPAVRESGGVFVVVSSYAAWTFSPIAGVAYSASKSGLLALTRTLNAQESRYGVRACLLCPGDVDTDFLDLRPSVPDAAARQWMLQPDDVARSIQFVLDSPGHVKFDEIVISPVSQGGS